MHHKPREPPAQRIIFDEFNSDLNFNISSDGITGASSHQNGFEYMWAGCRGTHGVRDGKVCFEVHVLEKLPVNMPETETNPHVMRVGWSVNDANLQVGEDYLSYGYGGTGKVSVNNKFVDYGQPYSSNDIITCHIDLEANPKAISFSKNGQYLGVAFRLGPEADGKVFYPHVTMKNMRCMVNFGSKNPLYSVAQGFSMMEWLPGQQLVRAPPGPQNSAECEIIMMVGLPGSGKTYWAENYCKQHPEKKYHILGTNTVMEKMKVMNLSRDRNYHGRWDALIDQATDAFNKELKIAERRARNYILDQTNVYSTARQRKMNNFKGYRRIAAVVVCNNEVLKERTAKREREEGKLVPEEAVMKMKANFTLPQVGQIFDDVWFVEDDRVSSEKLVKQFQREGQTFKQAAGESKRPSETKRQTNFSVQHEKNNHSQSSPGHQVSRGNFRDRSRRPTPKGSTGPQNNYVPYKEEVRISTEKHAEQFQREGQTFKQAAYKAKRPSETRKQNNVFVQHGKNNHSQSSPGHQTPHDPFRDHSRRPTPQSSIGSRNNYGSYKDGDRISSEKHAKQFQREGPTFKQAAGGAKRPSETKSQTNFTVQHGKNNHSQSSPGHQVSHGNFRDRSRRPTPKGSTGSQNNNVPYKEDDRISTEKHAEQFQREGQTFKQTTCGAKQLNETRKQDNFLVQHGEINHFRSPRGHSAPHGPFKDRSRRATPQDSFGPRNFRELPKTNCSWGYFRVRPSANYPRGPHVTSSNAPSHDRNSSFGSQRGPDSQYRPDQKYMEPRMMDKNSDTPTNSGYSNQSPYGQGQNNRDWYWAHNNGSYEQRQRCGAPTGNQYASGNSYGGWGGRYGAQGQGYSNSGQDDWRAPDQGHIDRMYGHQ